MLSSTGIGSGLDVPNIIGKLMEVERLPLVKLQNRQGGMQSKISSFGMLKSMMSNFNDALTKFSDTSKIKAHSTQSSNEAVLTSAISSSATPSVSKYSVDVISLAQSHKISSPLFLNATDPVGEGTLTLSVAGKTFDFNLAANNNSLNDVRDGLNKRLNAEGIRANIINVNGGSHLMISTQNTGVNNAIKMTVSADVDGNNQDLNGLSRLVFDPLGTKNMSEISTALDAEVKVDGFVVSSASNTLDKTIPGVRLELKSVGSSNLTVNSDDSDFKTAVSDVVSSYNSLQDILVGFKSGQLKGEAMLSSIEQKLRSVFAGENKAVKGMSAYKMGIEFDRYGKMSFNDARFNTLSSVDKSQSLDFLSLPKSGMAVQLGEVMDLYVGAKGFIDSVTTGLNSQVRYMDSSIESMNRRLVSREITMTKQFTALDTLIANMDATSGFLTQQLESMQAMDTKK
ncbi:MAG: flagellar filament capping protein FliD [Gammaproteobacteria bacterium]|nr:flagellar filament capping protein FliD [Gammaproteobacteria bacterium]